MEPIKYLKFLAIQCYMENKKRHNARLYFTEKLIDLILKKVDLKYFTENNLKEIEKLNKSQLLFILNILNNLKD